MRTLSKFTVAASFALAFTLNGCPADGSSTCGGVEYDTDEFNCIDGELVSKDKSPIGGVSSSDGGGSSSSGGNVIIGGIEFGTLIDERDEAVYKTVKIGGQWWMAENLNYAGAGECYLATDSYCDKFGRLYDWATAMMLPSSCNDSRCDSLLSTKHQGICPTGWHIPSQAEWNILVSYVQTAQDCSNCAGKYLKATSEWNNNGNGLDTYGFTSLPGGEGGTSPGVFDGSGSKARYWRATEYDRDTGYILRMNDEWAGADLTLQRKAISSSVRCIKD